MLSQLSYIPRRPICPALETPNINAPLIITDGCPVVKQSAAVWLAPRFTV